MVRSPRLLERLQFFAGLEAHGFSRRDADLFAGTGIAPDASLSRLHAEYTEFAQLNPLAAPHGVLQRLKDSLHGLFGFCAADIRLCYDGIHNV
jgi:hypothetical protein